MRITVGGLLSVMMVTGVAGAVVLNQGSFVDGLMNRGKDLESSVLTFTKMVNLGKKTEPAKTEEPVVTETPAAVEATPPAEPISENTIVPVEPQVAAPVETEPPKIVEPAAPAPKAKKSRRRKARKTSAKIPAKTSATAPAPAAKAAAAKRTSKDALIGNYVVVKMSNGREVRGVLKDRNSTKVVIELPGMGPFEYAAGTITSIEAAQ